MKIPIPTSGIPEPEGEWNKKVKQILEQRTSINTGTGCWEWLGAVNGHGYGTVVIDHIPYYVHRLSAMIFLDYVPGYVDSNVLHRCNNKICWNFEHLYIGTKADNARDRVEDGKGSQYSNVTYCVNGHEFTEENTYYSVLKDGKHRRCRECRKLNQRRYVEKMKLVKMRDVS